MKDKAQLQRELEMADKLIESVYEIWKEAKIDEDGLTIVQEDQAARITMLLEC